MPPPAAGRSSPGPSAALLPCRPKAQELRSGLSSNSLRFLTPGRAKGLIAFGSNGLDRPAAGGSAEAFSNKLTRADLDLGPRFAHNKI